MTEQAIKASESEKDLSGLAIQQYTKLIPSAVLGLKKTFRGCQELFALQIASGDCQLWRIGTENGDSWMITRKECLPDQKPELVVCCYQGKDLRRVTAQIIASAKRMGFGSVRYHTPHKGLNRLLKGFGFEPYETVYRRVL